MRADLKLARIVLCVSFNLCVFSTAQSSPEESRACIEADRCDITPAAGHDSFEDAADDVRVSLLQESVHVAASSKFHKTSHLGVEGLHHERVSKTVKTRKRLGVSRFASLASISGGSSFSKSKSKQEAPDDNDTMTGNAAETGSATATENTNGNTNGTVAEDANSTVSNNTNETATAAASTGILASLGLDARLEDVPLAIWILLAILCWVDVLLLFCCCCRREVEVKEVVKEVYIRVPDSQYPVPQQQRSPLLTGQPVTSSAPRLLEPSRLAVYSPPRSAPSSGNFVTTIPPTAVGSIPPTASSLGAYPSYSNAAFQR